MTKPDPFKHSRGIDSIAHLFLTQAGNDMPRRRPPKSFDINYDSDLVGRGSVSPKRSGSDNPMPPDHSGPNDQTPDYDQDDSELIMGEILLAYHLEKTSKLSLGHPLFYI